MFGVSLEIWFVYGLIVLAVFLFVNKRISFDITSLILLAILVVSGILTPREGLSGFSNPATVTIACMFILSEGLRQTGALDIVGDYFFKLSKLNYRLAMFIIMLVIGVISAFINNTAAVAIFIPVLISLSRDLGESASKLLMPMSFAAMFGGVCTLIGTSTNLLVDSIATDNNLAGFTMFEFAPVGLIFFVVGFIYLFTFGINLIPERRKDESLTDTFEMQSYLTDVILQPHSPFVDTPLKNTKLIQDLDLDIVEVFDEDGESKPDRMNIELEANDILRIRGSVKELNKLLNREDVFIKPSKHWEDRDFEIGNAQLVESVVAPESSIEGKQLKDLQLWQKYEALVLAIRQQGELQKDNLQDIRLQSGTSILLYAKKERVNDIKTAEEFVLATEIELPEHESSKITVALGIIAGVVGFAALGILPIVATAICGVILMVLTGCLTNEEAYQSINWKVIFLLGGVLPLGIAMQKTGAAQLMVDVVITQFASLGPTAVLSAFFFMSMMLTNLISNQATAALLAPIAIEAASSIDVNAAPLLVAVTMAASLSFMTPIGYQTNTMIFGPGQYKFTDFVKVGTPLNLLFWIIGTFAIPYFWPF
ncbi:SLC13 family permease [Gracilimonas mengyeensis]|uniref:TrkA-C domain-containing protein n=1 Tax=Gracilimonas mengyeensis TaxID=1302730 RepID=A0A521ANA0_9BACT|nr:SLC13 family permease [Gracilimonas mengyeensis]SMO36286.1 TrkA-C domain-containing protein [Gracilimonas mengyeensis]